jgi:hypothetical protein
VPLVKHLLLCLLLMSCLGFAQEKKSELGLLLGAEFIQQATTISGNQMSFGRSITYSVDYARHPSGGKTALVLEFPFAASPSYRVSSTQQNAITSLATLYVTPSLRIRLASHAPLSPWVSGGFGYGLSKEVVCLRMVSGMLRYTGT